MDEKTRQLINSVTKHNNSLKHRAELEAEMYIDDIEDTMSKEDLVTYLRYFANHLNEVRSNIEV